MLEHICKCSFLSFKVRATNLQELVYKNGQAGITKATVSITFDNLDKKQSPLGYEQYDEITITRQVFFCSNIALSYWFFSFSYMLKVVSLQWTNSGSTQSTYSLRPVKLGQYFKWIGKAVHIIDCFKSWFLMQSDSKVKASEQKSNCDTKSQLLKKRFLLNVIACCIMVLLIPITLITVSSSFIVYVKYLGVDKAINLPNF